MTAETLLRALVEIEEEERRSLELVAVQFIGRNEQAIERMLKKLVRRFTPAERPQLIEAGRDGAYQSVASSMRTYDSAHASGASMRTHVLGNARWCAWKAMRKELVHMRQDTRDIDGRSQHEDRAAKTKDAVEEVQCLLAKLSSEQAELLTWRYIDGLSLGEIAELLDCSYSTAYRRVEQAVVTARSASNKK